MPGGPHMSARLSVPGGNKCFRSISSHTLPSCTDTLDTGYHSPREQQTTQLKSAASLGGIGLAEQQRHKPCSLEYSEGFKACMNSITPRELQCERLFYRGFEAALVTCQYCHKSMRPRWWGETAHSGSPSARPLQMRPAPGAAECLPPPGSQRSAAHACCPPCLSGSPAHDSPMSTSGSIVPPSKAKGDF